jgi:hypothetical protein
MLDPTTTGIVDKEDRMKQFSRALKQIEKNIARVERLKHSNYKVKSDNIASQIMFLLLLKNASDILFDLFPNFLFDETIQFYNSFNYKITLPFIIQQGAI